MSFTMFVLALVCAAAILYIALLFAWAFRVTGRKRR
jgi:hypothetical protein